MYNVASLIVRQYSLGAGTMFNNKVVLVTGASSGIGASCAMKFAELNASLSLIGRNVNKLNETASSCEQICGRKPLTIVADITNIDDIERIINNTLNKYGKIDVLVNSAGVSSLAGIQPDIEAFDYVMASNLRGPYLLTTKIIPHLIETRGNIVNISSMLSFKPLPAMTAYCMSKAAIDMFSKCLALELGPKGVRVNTVNPGPVRTPLFTTSGMKESDVKAMFRIVESNAPLRIVTEATDVANIVTFVASESARCVTGCSYFVDSGLSLGDAK
ncbi:uncharacterized protein LOC114250511 [Bombyx mandarina]|uniref:Uncharacterized protein LOC114250511 n=1 Tax=Bombyx mandarina TaxID=7092 RepID=A0A6J2KD53_BOMMA|nr:uncharacterized protein LOC114250511 [Bombyx mandarina]